MKVDIFGLLNDPFDIDELDVYDISLYFAILRLANKLGWKSEFGLPMETVMEASRHGSPNRYRKSLKRLTDNGLIEIVMKGNKTRLAPIIRISKLTSLPLKGNDESLMHTVIKINNTYTNHKIADLNFFEVEVNGTEYHKKIYEILVRNGYQRYSDLVRNQYKEWLVYSRKDGYESKEALMSHFENWAKLRKPLPNEPMYRLIKKNGKERWVI